MTDAPVTLQALSSADLAQMRARAQAATPGPWEIDPQGTPDEHEQPLIVADGGLADIALMESPNEPTEDQAAADAYMLANAEFIAACRDFVPRALAHIERLTAQLKDEYTRGRFSVSRELDAAIDAFNDDDSKGIGHLAEVISPWLDWPDVPLTAQGERRCVWTQNQSTWNSACGETFVVRWPGAKFCLYCGGALEVQAR